MKIVMLVGPPGAGKSTFVKETRQPGDCQVDMDLIPKELPQEQRRAIRKALLQRAATSLSTSTCWFSTAAPTRAQRKFWHSFVPIEQTLMFVFPIEEVLARQTARDGPGHPLTRGVFRWYQVYEPPSADDAGYLFVPRDWRSIAPHERTNHSVHISRGTTAFS